MGKIFACLGIALGLLVAPAGASNYNDFFSPIKSIQTGTITFDAGAATSGTATITSVSTSKSTVALNGVVWNTTSTYATTTDTLKCFMGRIILTNATTVTGTIGGLCGSAPSITFYFTVTEFY